MSTDLLKFVDLVDEMREAQKELEMHSKNDYEEYLDLWSDVETLESKVDKMLQTLKRNNNEKIIICIICRLCGNFLYKY